MQLIVLYKHKLFLLLLLLVSYSPSAFCQLTGTKKIPGDYPTITAAVTAINTSGVGAGGVIFSIAAGYTETISSTISLSATGTVSNPVIFQKDPTTVGANPLLTAYTSGVGTPATAIQDGIWRILGSDYITIDAIDLAENPANTSNPATMEYGFGLYKSSTSNGCQYVTIKNCVITLTTLNNALGTAPMVDGSSGIIVMNALATAANAVLAPTTGGTNSNNSFYTNTIRNCNTGIAVIGYAAPSPYTLADLNNDIGGIAPATGNTITNFGGADAAANPAVAIRSLAQYDFNVSYNTINNNNGSGVNHPNVLRGILVGSATSAETDITFNTVTLKGGGTTQNITGIENAAGATAAANTININNNLITNGSYTTATTGGFYGINNLASPAVLNMNTNTVSNNSSSATTTGFLYGIYNSGTAATASITGNIFSGNSTAALTTGLFCGILNAGVVTTLNINNNSLTGSATTSLSGPYYAIYNSAKVTTSININANNIGSVSSPAISFNAANSGTHYLIYNGASASTAALSMSNNNIQNINYATAGTGTNTYIYNTAASLSQNINANTFTNLNVNTTGSVTLISNSVVVPGTGTQNVNSNSIVGSFTKAAGGTVVLFSSTAASVTGSVINNNNNNFSNITVTGATIVTGWQNTDAGASTKTIQGNTFNNWTGGTSAITVMSVSLTGINNATTGNLINNISSQGAITGIATGAGNDKIYSNIINTISTTGAFAVTGIAVTSGTVKNVYANKIYDLQANNAGGTVNGISVSGTTSAVVTANVYNNTIGDLRTPIASSADAIRGISVSSTRVSSTINVYYNTVYLNASSTAANFGSSGVYHAGSSTSTTATLNLRNNIVVNVSTPGTSGFVVAYRRSSTSLTNYGTASNNNLFYAGSPATNRLIFFDGTNSDQTLTAYKTRVTARDALSVTEDLITSSKFLSTAGSSVVFLHLDPSKPTLAESGAVNISNFTTDYDGDIRQGNSGYAGTGSAPDIGADEFNGSRATALAGTVNVGTGQAYTSLTNAGGLFAGINSLGLSGNLVVNITSDLTEDGTNILNLWTEQGVGGYNLNIQPSASSLRTISGNVLAGMIRLNGAKRVTINGSNGTSNNYLTFRNTNTAGTTGTAFTLVNGASNNAIRFCNVEAYANATNGVILFGSSTIAGGNSTNTISNCNINATVAGNTGNVAIYSLGTATRENTGNVISNNNIFNYRDRGLDIASTGSLTWTISGNSFYNGDVTGSINYAAASAIHGIRILGGTGYSVLSNFVGGNAPLAAGTAAVYASTLGNLTFTGILLTTTAATPVSNIKGNTISTISLSAVPNNASTILSVFSGIETTGSGINIGGTLAGEGNTVGSNITNGSILVTTTTALVTHRSYIRGINCGSSGGSVIGNQVGGIDIRNIGAVPAPSFFYGVNVNVAAAPSQVNSNIIGSNGASAAANSIRVLSTSTSTSTNLTGITIGPLVTSTVLVNGNIIQNFSHQSPTASGIFTGISNAAISTAVITIANNTIAANTSVATSGSSYGIFNNSANPALLTISSNLISGNSVTSSGGILYGVYVGGTGTAPSAVSISDNIFTLNNNGASTGAYMAIYNVSATPSLSITGNTISGNLTSNTASLFYAISNAGAVTTTININGNFIGTSSAAAITYNAANSGALVFVSNTAGATAATLSISNNVFQNINYAVPGTGANTYISNTAATSSRAINGNSFVNMNVNTSGSITFITDNAAVSATGTQNINNNSISGTFTKRAGGTLTLFTSTGTSVAGGVINNNSNNFSNITVTAATTIAGWVNTDAGNGTRTIQNNSFTNWSGGTNPITVMSVNLSNTTNSTTGNIINNITAGAAVTGITTAAGNDNIFLNTINTLSSTAALAVTGIAVTAGTTKNIYKNKIYDLGNNNASGSVNGILVSGGTTVNIYNNLVGDLRTSAANSATDLVRGISVTSTTAPSSINVYYNTVYINASSTGTTFNTSAIYHAASATATTAALNLRNNSLTNTSTPKGTGTTVVIRRSGTATNNYATSSNNNLLYAGTPGSSRLIYADGTASYQTLATHKTSTAPRDAASVTEDLTVKFLSTVGSSPLYLHMNTAVANALESAAANITGYTEDFDGQVRAGNPGYSGTSVTPDIGADEIFGIETVPPTISYTLLDNTTVTTNRSLSPVSITDASGVSNSAGSKPRIYYKRSSDANVWLDNTPSTNGWKFIEASNASSPFNFSIDYTLLYGGAAVTAGVIQYFVVAQDLATVANVGINSGSFNTAPASVALTATAFPVSGTINSYSIPFSGSYNIGSAEVFSSLTKANGLFAAVNSAGLMGNTIFNVISDLTEDGTNALNEWTNYNGAGYTLKIQPDATTTRTISGNVSAGLIRLDGADRVTIDGSNNTGSTYLIFKNTNTSGTTATAFTFLNGASNNTIRYCEASAVSNATNGVILFSGSSVAAGNSNNLVDYCNINSKISANTGSVGIYSGGTPGSENTGNTISNNAIYDYRERGIDIAATGSSGWTISGNSLFNGDASAGINYPASSALHGIRVQGGAGYSLLNNFIGGHRAQAAGGNAAYASTLGSLSYEGIQLFTSAATPVSNIKGNTIAAITVSSVPVAPSTTVFNGVFTSGAGINIGGTVAGEGNIVGANDINSSIVINTGTTSIANSSLISGINSNSSGGTIIGNQVGGVDINNTGSAPAPSVFQGIVVNSATAPPELLNNIIGSDGANAASNSIRVLSTSTSVNTSLTAIAIGVNVASPIVIDSNIIQNISNSSTMSSGSFTGISNAATSTNATITISNNTINDISTGSNSNINSGIYTGISASSPSAITGNTIDDIILSSSGTAAQVRGIYVTGSFAYTITNNTILDLSTASSKPADMETGNPAEFAIAGIINAASVGGQNISGNILYDFSANSTATVNLAITGIAVAGAASGNIFNNRISAFTNSATGSSVPGISGIMAADGTFNVYNNAVSISNTGNNNALKIYGIHHAAAGNWNYYFNSVSIGGSGTGTQRTAAFTRSLAGSPVLRNNLFINTRTGTGLNYAISNIAATASAGWTATSSNYNDLYSANPARTAEWGAGTSETFAQWKTASGGDANSVSRSVSFLASLYDLQLDTVTNCTVNNAGTPITTPVSISTDINLKLRSAVSPDLGAYEFGYTGFVIDVQNNSPVCAGSPVDLSVDPGDAYSPAYTWKSPGDSIVSNIQEPTIIAVPGNYTVTVTDINGCSVTDSTTVLIAARPTGGLSGATSLCEGGSANLTLTVTGTGNIAGTLSSGDEFTGTAPTIIIPVVPTTTTLYSVTSLSDESCFSIASDIPDKVAIVVTQTGGWLGTSGNNWFNALNWCGGIPGITTSVTIPGNSAVFPVVNTGTALANSVTIQNGATLTVTGADLQIGTTISNGGNFAVSNGGIILKGVAAQTIPVSAFAGNAIRNLTIDNPAGVTLAGTLNLSGILKVTTGQFNTAGYLTLLSTATQTALIDGSGAGNVLGNVTMQRYLSTGFGYKYFSSPFAAATVNEFANDMNLNASFPTFYKYVENQASSGWTNHTNASGLLNPTEGYAINFGSSSAPKTVDVRGVVNNGTIATPVLYNHNQPYTKGFNLVGNPYPSPIDWNASSGWTKTNIDNALYFFNASITNQYLGTYSSYINGVSSNGIANNVIASMQGFFVHVTNGAFPVAGQLTFNNSVRVNNLSPVFQSFSGQLMRISAGFEGDEKATDDAVIYFDENAAATFNRNYDALKLLNTNTSVPNLYAVSKDSARISIRAMNYPRDSVTVQPIGLHTEKDGMVSFKMKDLRSIPTSLHIYLYDSKANTYRDLRVGDAYSLYLPAGDYDNRFSIVFSVAEMHSVASPTESFDAYNSGGRLIIKSPLGQGEKAGIVIYNVQGQAIYKQEIVGDGIHEVNRNFLNGVYLVSITTKRKIQSKKLYLGK